MAIQHPDIQPAVNHSVQVAIAGAGPVGLMMANYLGQMGIDVLVVEKLDKLIDYPRAIGIDDEALRTMQSVGLVDNVLPHTTPWHAMRFLTPKGRCFADIQPMTDEFGWPRREQSGSRANLDRKSTRLNSSHSSPSRMPSSA